MITSFLTVLSAAWLTFFVCGVICGKYLYNRAGHPMPKVKPYAVYLTLLAFVWLAWSLRQ